MFIRLQVWWTCLWCPSWATWWTCVTSACTAASTRSLTSPSVSDSPSDLRSAEASWKVSGSPGEQTHSAVFQRTVGSFLSFGVNSVHRFDILGTESLKILFLAGCCGSSPSSTSCTLRSWSSWEIPRESKTKNRCDSRLLTLISVLLSVRCWICANGMTLTNLKTCMAKDGGAPFVHVPYLFVCCMRSSAVADLFGSTFTVPCSYQFEFDWSFLCWNKLLSCACFQGLVLNDTKPVQYVTYKQQPKSQDELTEDGEMYSYK